MKKIYLLVFSLLFAGGVVYSQTPVSWSDNFDNNVLDTVYWKTNPGIYVPSVSNGELTYTITKESLWDGFSLSFPDQLDLSENPYASFKIKTDSALDLRIYLWDINEIDTLYNRSNADVWVVPGETYFTYYFDWRGKFLHADTDENGDELIIEMDSTSIDGFLINIDPGVESPLYMGKLVFDDVMIGSLAELPTAEVMVTGSAIGSVGTTVVSDIPEGTLVQALLDGLTHNGDDLVIHAAGSDGRAGIEALGTAILDPSMDLVVSLEGSSPRKYDLLVAPPALSCYYRTDFPTVDAEIDPVWETVPVHDLSFLVEGAIDGPTDLAATFRVMWDEVSLFYLLEVTDDIEFVDNVSDAPWTDDAVEIWLDLNNSKNTSYLPSETDEYQFVFSKGITNLYTLHHHDQIDGMDWAWANSQGGYIFEIEIPWLTSLEWLDRFGTNMPDFGHKVGMDIHVNDDDDGAEREATIGWFTAENEAWNNPSTLGDMQMKEEIVESINESGSSLRFRMHPNPAADYLQLISTRGISRIEVVNMLGQSVLVRQVSNERMVVMDLDGLSNSVYLVTVYDTEGDHHSMKLIKK